MNKGSLTEKLRGSHLAKIVILLIAMLAIGGLAGCSSVSAQPGTSSTSTSTGNGSSTGTTPTPDPSTTDTPTQQPSQSTTDTSAIDSASTDAQIEAFIQAFKDAGFPDVQKKPNGDGANANWGPGNSSHLGAITSGNNVWYLRGNGSDIGTGYKTAVIAVMSKHGVGESLATTVVGDQGVPASTILEIIHSLKYDADNYKVVYQAQ